MQSIKLPDNSKKIYALVDCNNFYASCEAVFEPKFIGKPLVILSNNDGCIVARSAEAKKLNFKFGLPYFKHKKLIKKHNVQVLSSNYTLYGDMSKRVMDTLKLFSPDIEIYSIDEAFLLLNGFENRDLCNYGKKIKDTVRKHTGIPVSIGIANTKTLAKAANKIAKKYDKYNGLFSFINVENISDYLKYLDVSDIWGIGFKYSDFLKKKGINTAKDLINLSDDWIKQHLKITGLRTVMELRGISCINDTFEFVNKKNIGCSRSFGKSVNNYNDLKEALITYASSAAKKLRRQKSAAQAVLVYITTNRFKENEPQYSNSITLPLSPASSFTPDIIKLAVKGLKTIYKKGYNYKKTGILLLDIVQENKIQLDLFNNNEKSDINNNLSSIIDNINVKYGKNILKYAGGGINQDWKMKRGKLSPEYTTNWQDLPKAK